VPEGRATPVPDKPHFGGLLTQTVISWQDARGKRWAYTTAYRPEQIEAAVLDAEARHGKTVRTSVSTRPIPAE
jgi:hypothetical protein